MAEKLIVSVTIANEMQAEVMTSPQALFAINDLLVDKLGLEPGFSTQTRIIDLRDYEAHGVEAIDFPEMVRQAVHIRVMRARRKAGG